MRVNVCKNCKWGTVKQKVSDFPLPLYFYEGEPVPPHPPSISYICIECTRFPQVFEKKPDDYCGEFCNAEYVGGKASGLGGP